MEQQVRNEFEHYCALAEIEEAPEKFAEIARTILRILDDQHVRLSRRRLSRGIVPPSNVA